MKENIQLAKRLINLGMREKSISIITGISKSTLKQLDNDPIPLTKLDITNIIDNFMDGLSATEICYKFNIPYAQLKDILVSEKIIGERCMRLDKLDINNIEDLICKGVSCRELCKLYGGFIQVISTIYNKCISEGNINKRNRHWRQTNDDRIREIRADYLKSGNTRETMHNCKTSTNTINKYCNDLFKRKMTHKDSHIRANIIKDYYDGNRIKDIANKYDMKYNTVFNVIRNRRDMLIGNKEEKTLTTRYHSIKLFPDSKHADEFKCITKGNDLLSLTKDLAFPARDRLYIFEDIDCPTLGVVKLDGKLYPIRSKGTDLRYSSKQEESIVKSFMNFIHTNAIEFDKLLNDNDKVFGKWISGTKYENKELSGFIVLDILDGDSKRSTYSEMKIRCANTGFNIIPILATRPMKPQRACELIPKIDGIEPLGVIYRYERDNRYYSMTKYLLR